MSEWEVEVVEKGRFKRHSEVSNEVFVLDGEMEDVCCGEERVYEINSYKSKNIRMWMGKAKGGKDVG